MKNIFKNIKKLKSINRFNLIFNNIKSLNISNFQIIFLIYAIIFSVFLYLSIPSLFDYSKYTEQLKIKFASEFKLNLKNLNDIQYRFIPTPHLIIKNAKLSFDSSDQTQIAELKDIKIFLSIIDLYKDKKIKIKKMQIKKGNFYLKDNTLKLFNKHLHFKILKPIEIINSNFFYINKKNETATISPIRNMKYFINYKTKEKNLKIKGKLFDSEFNFIWKKNYENPNEYISQIGFKNPNFNLNNKIKKNLENSSITGKSKITFLNTKLNLNFLLNKDHIIFETLNNKSDSFEKIKIKGNIDLDPFFFDTQLILSNIDINILTQKLFSLLYSSKNTTHPSFNGNLNLKVKNFGNKLLDNLELNFLFHEDKIVMNNSNIYLKKIGKIDFSKINYIVRLDKLFIRTDMELNIENQLEFYRRFQVAKENRKKIKKIFFTLEKNVDDNSFYISNLNLNKKINKNNENVVENFSNEIKNIQQLTKVIRDNFKNINRE